MPEREMPVHGPDILSRGMRPVRRGSAFTLVELLIVIGIIVVLIAVLLPAINRAREQGRSVGCLNNLKQLGLAMNAYVLKYERFPRPGVDNMREDWFHRGQSNHLKSKGGIAEFLDDGGPVTSPVWLCPADVIDTHVVAGYPYSYSANFIICTYSTLHSQTPPLDKWPTVVESDGVRRSKTLS